MPAAGVGTTQAGQGSGPPCSSAGRRHPPQLYYLRDSPFSLPHTLLIPHTAGHAEQSEQQGMDPDDKHRNGGLLPLLWQGLSQIPRFRTRRARGFWSSPTPGHFFCRNPLWNRSSATSHQRPRTRKFQNRTRTSRWSVQRFYLTVIKGEADDDSKPVNPGLGFTDNMHQIKVTKISLGAGQGRVRGKDVATRKPHVLGPSSNTTSTW